MILPAQISQAGDQRKRYNNQNELRCAAVLRFFLIIEQVVEVSGGTGTAAIRIQTQAGSLTRRRIVQSKK